MRDDFSTTDKLWLVKADESFTTEIVDQQFRASTAARSGVQFNIPGTSSVRGGVRIDVDVAMTGPETRAGLTCRNKAADYYYRAEVDSRGYWQVTPYVGQIGVTSNPYVQAQSSDRTVPALRGTGWNRISFECAGSDETGDRVTLRLWVNGSLIAETEVESGFGPGGLSLYAGSGAESGEVRFDNLVVSRV